MCEKSLDQQCHKSAENDSLPVSVQFSDISPLLNKTVWVIL